MPPKKRKLEDTGSSQSPTMSPRKRVNTVGCSQQSLDSFFFSGRNAQNGTTLDRNSMSLIHASRMNLTNGTGSDVPREVIVIDDDEEEVAHSDKRLATESVDNAINSTVRRTYFARCRSVWKLMSLLR